MATPHVAVIGGADSHKYTHYAAAVDDQGRLLGAQQFPATEHGYRDLLDWMRSHGTIRAIGVEGAGSFGADLARSLAKAGEQVVEVNRPNRRARRMDGRSDHLDAENVARAVLGQASTAFPKAKSGPVEVIRALRVTLTGSHDRLLAAGTKRTLRDLARRCKALEDEIQSLNRQLDALVRATASDLLELHGVGVDIAAQFLVTAGDNPERIRSEAAFAKLCGVAPQPPSSRRTTGRHRLSRSGDRAANSALYIVTSSRSCACADTSPPWTTSNEERKKA